MVTVFLTNNEKTKPKSLLLFFALFLAIGTAIAQDKAAESAAELAKKYPIPLHHSSVFRFKTILI